MSDRVLDTGHALCAFLRSKEFFSDATAGAGAKVIGVLCEDMGDLDNRIEKALMQATGICTVIRMLGGKIPSGDNGAPVFDPAVYRLRTYENPARNRSSGGTQQSAAKVAGAIERLLWTFNESVPGYNPIVPRERAWGQENGVPFYDVLCETEVAIDPSEPTRTESLVGEDGNPLITEGGTPLLQT
jgi:hypothetical protein